MITSIFGSILSGQSLVGISSRDRQAMAIFCSVGFSPLRKCFPMHNGTTNAKEKEPQKGRIK
jgi:hypothetical protein